MRTKSEKVCHAAAALCDVTRRVYNHVIICSSLFKLVIVSDRDLVFLIVFFFIYICVASIDLKRTIFFFWKEIVYLEVIPHIIFLNFLKKQIYNSPTTSSVPH